MRLLRADGTDVGVHRGSGRATIQPSNPPKGIPNRAEMLDLLSRALQDKLGYQKGRWYRKVEHWWVLLMDEMDVYEEIRAAADLVYDGFMCGFYEGTHGRPLVAVTDKMLHHRNDGVGWFERNLQERLRIDESSPDSKATVNPFNFR